MKRAQVWGFTLIEVLVVLVLLGLVSAVSYPRVQSIYESYRAVAIKDNIKAQLVNYAVQARLSRQHITVGAVGTVGGNHDSNQLALEPLDSEKITLAEPIAINAKGVCMGGEVRVHLRSRTYHLYASPPYCEIAKIQ